MLGVERHLHVFNLGGVDAFQLLPDPFQIPSVSFFKRLDFACVAVFGDLERRDVGGGCLCCGFGSGGGVFGALVVVAGISVVHGAVTRDVGADGLEGRVRVWKGGGAFGVEFGVRVGSRVEAGVGRRRHLSRGANSAST